MPALPLPPLPFSPAVFLPAVFVPPVASLVPGQAEWGSFLVAWTIRLALLAYALTLTCLVLRPAVTRTVGHQRTIRLAWTAAWLLYALHVVAAFHFVHHWDHRHAVEHTAEKSRQVVGLAFGGGIYFNHLLTLLWTADVLWLWIRPQSYWGRAFWISATLHIYILFLAVNGAIVFESGPARWFGIPLLAVIGLLFFCRPREWKDRELKDNEQ